MWTSIYTVILTRPSRLWNWSTILVKMEKLKKERIRKVNPVSQKVKLFRASEPLLSVFMWGINHTVCIAGFICLMHVYCILLPPIVFCFYFLPFSPHKGLVFTRLQTRGNTISGFWVDQYTEDFCSIIQCDGQSIAFTDKNVGNRSSLTSWHILKLCMIVARV